MESKAPGFWAQVWEGLKSRTATAIVSGLALLVAIVWLAISDSLRAWLVTEVRMPRWVAIGVPILAALVTLGAAWWWFVARRSPWWSRITEIRWDALLWTWRWEWDRTKRRPVSAEMIWLECRCPTCRTPIEEHEIPLEDQFAEQRRFDVRCFQCDVSLATWDDRAAVERRVEAMVSANIAQKALRRRTPAPAVYHLR